MWDELALKAYNDEMRMSDLCALQRYESLAYLVPEENTEIRLPTEAETASVKEFRAPWTV